MNFHVGFLNKIPVIELFMGVVLIVGAIYYFARAATEAVGTGGSTGRGSGGDRPGDGHLGIPGIGGGREAAAPAPRVAKGTLLPMKIVTTPAAAAFIEERGGKVWVWLDPRRGLVGSYVWLEAHCEPPGSSRRSQVHPELQATPPVQGSKRAMVSGSTTRSRGWSLPTSCIST